MELTLGMGLGAACHGLPPLFSPLSVTPLLWWDPSDATKRFQDSAGTIPAVADGDPVGRIADGSGNGNHGLQATAGLRPLFKTTGGVQTIEGDGVDDWLRAVFTLPQPFVRISLIRQRNWVVSARIFGGGSANAGVLSQSGTSPNIAMSSNTTLQLSDDPPIDTWAVITEEHNGANSRAAVNNNAYVVGNAGTTVPGGMTMFASHAGTTPANAACGGVMVFTNSPSDEIIQRCRRWLGAKAGILL